ncbi:MAG: aspartate/glutamate racemase family protein, partial [Pseudomonadota bacterium]
MRLLLINPNMTRSMTDRMIEVACSVAPEGVEIVPVTATRGFPYIASRAEAQIAGGFVLEMIVEHAEAVDAVVVAAFGDPGLAAARDLFDLPVVGMAEASLMTAAMLGERFSVVTFTPHMVRWYVDCVRLSGLEARFTGVRCPSVPPETVDGVASHMRPELIDLAERATREDGADVVILGGAPLAGLAPQIAPQTPGLLVDPIAAATLQAVALSQ